jgi:DNA-binding transcriptional ArsR family regulator
MLINRPLNDVLGNETRIEILRTFFKYPGEFTGRQVARLCGLPHATVQKQLDILGASGVILVKHVGRSKIYSLNPDSLLYAVLDNLFKQEGIVRKSITLLIEESIQKNQQLRNHLVHASLYGSMVAGTDTAESDIDILLVLKDNYDQDVVDLWKDQLRSTITTISGIHFHPFSEPLSRWRLTNAQTKKNIMMNSELVYGKTLNDLEKQWQRNQKQEQHHRAPTKSS